MTTPAKNLESLTYDSYEHYRKIEPGGYTLDSTGSRVYRYDLDKRPASSNAERVGGFKKCLQWYHYGGSLQKNQTFEEYRFTGTSVVAKDVGNIYDNGFPLPQEVSSNSRNACLVKALENLKNQDFHVGNFLAEADKTIDMIANRSQSIARSVLRFRKKHPRLFDKVKKVQLGGLPRHRWCEIPNLWLELQYGWIPLMSDVYGGLNHLSRRGRFARPFVTAKASHNDVRDIYNYATSVSGLRKKQTWQQEDVIQTYLVYGLDYPGLAELSSMGLINPLEIVWETTRYSFVVDWFLPIGSWLSSLTADVGFTFITGGQSTKRTLVYRDSVVDNQPPFYTYSHIGDDSVSGKLTYYDRGCYNSTPVPGIYVKNPLSLRHVLNAFALLAQAFSER